MAQTPPASVWAAFLRLWFVMLFSFFLAKFLFNLTVLRRIDLRPVAFQEILLVPLVQSIVFWFITRRRRRTSVTASGPPD